MKKKNTLSFKVLFILTAILLLFSFNASNTFAEFYVIAGSRGVGTEIKSLPYTILSPGFYYITKDLTCATSTHGITITADNVTLDLMGFSLIYGGGAGDHDGIYMNGRSNVEIRNGTVRLFSRHGIYEEDLDDGDGHRIINIRARDNTQNGIYLSGKGHLIERCTAVKNSNHGINVYYGSTIIGNTCYDNDKNGIYAHNGSTIINNTCYYNGSTPASDYGIYAGQGPTVIGNTCYLNTGTGIYAGIGSVVTGNACHSNQMNGIYAHNGSTVTGNTCYGNTNWGIYLQGDNLLDQNNAMGNGSHKDRNSCTSCTISTTNHFPDPEPDP